MGEEGAFIFPHTQRILAWKSMDIDICMGKHLKSLPPVMYSRSQVLTNILTKCHLNVNKSYKI